MAPSYFLKYDYSLSSPKLSGGAKNITLPSIFGPANEVIIQLMLWATMFSFLSGKSVLAFSIIPRIISTCSLIEDK